MKKDALHEVEKPYAFRYPVPGATQTNMEMEKVERIPISDIRGRKHEHSFEADGFVVLELHRTFDYSIFFDNEELQVYFRTLETLLKEFLGATEVHVFRHGVRKRHPDFPVSTGTSYEYDQPTSVAHIGQYRVRNCQVYWEIDQE